MRYESALCYAVLRWAQKYIPAKQLHWHTTVNVRSTGTGQSTDCPIKSTKHTNRITLSRAFTTTAAADDDATGVLWRSCERVSANASCFGFCFGFETRFGHSSWLLVHELEN